MRGVSVPELASVTCTSMLLCLTFSINASCLSIPDHHLLHSALHHFEVLHTSHLKHIVRKDSRIVHFSTLGREFQLFLTPREHLFHDQVRVTVIRGGTARPHAIHYNHFFEGDVVGDPNSSVTAHLNHDTGILTASIRTVEDHYYVEPSHRHFTQAHDFHMISYRVSDLKFNLTSHSSQHFCGNSEHSSETSTAITSHSELEHHMHKWNSLTKTTTREVNVASNYDGRLKRQTSNTVCTQPDCVCSMHLVATHQFHRQYAPTSNVDDTVLFMVQVIDEVDREIFNPTIWTGGLRNLGLDIRNVTVFEDENGPGYNVVREWDSGSLLKARSQPCISRLLHRHCVEALRASRTFAGNDILKLKSYGIIGQERTFACNDWSSVCLAHLFTATGFTDGRLGVAYVASSNPQATGGICSRFTRLEGCDGTANVGVSSYLNGNRRLLLAEAKLVTAHELGHNWGSEHDPTDAIGDCNPELSADAGKYLMFPSAVDGNQANNNRFSTCSQDVVADVLNAKASCFDMSMMSQCGNFRVEVGEACDAGFLGMVRRDPCCNEDCTRANGASCSDTNDICCEGCMPAPSNTTCRTYVPNNRLCLKNVNCNGINGSCPTDNEYVDVGTPCGSEGRCYPPDTPCNSSGCRPDNSTANGSIVQCFNFCELLGMTECFCSGENECYFCCRESNNQSLPCNRVNPVQRRPDGTTCTGGFCREGICMPATQDLIQRLFSLFTDLTIDSFRQLLRENIVGSVLILTTIVWIPLTLALHIMDKKFWPHHDYKAVALGYEQERLVADEEDELDMQAMDDMSPGIVQPEARIGLMRMNSRTESTQPDFFSSGDLCLSPTTPVYPMWSPRRLSVIKEAEESQELDPEKHDIRAYCKHAGQPDEDPFSKQFKVAIDNL